ncbi:MJ0042-type zinc finger domain-containing protein [Neisseria chenwenguii]|uniref:Uncharacterized protein n=1 Tax=Neisseria chenwenguii TaxID=1853278 RepID=A0A220S1D5_9NEIS|nr:MJ0042-type zinc finger domain-containing protein [Neisseria chenwenguii]ASK27186.1 hypothetical protein BG910_05010 [Neisseria chenwenguii]ROV54888.1 hypothetical protein EGS38_10400 [Neisseria chenwenguii]
MPACTCPHCATNIWVNDSQLSVAKGFVVCTKCEGLFKAKENLADLKGQIQTKPLPSATNDKRQEKHTPPKAPERRLSRNELADLLDNVITTSNAANAAAAVQEKEGVNWTLAVMIALTVLIMQLFYLVLLL